MRSPKPTYDVVVLPGDGIGVEVAADARALLDALAPKLGVQLAITEIPCGGRYYVEHGERDWPVGSEERCRAADVILLGADRWNGPDGQPATMKDGKMAGWSPVIGNRIKLNLYANVRPIKLLPGVRHGLSGRFLQAWEPGQVDMIFVRENTEGLYSGIGGRAGDAAIDTRVITRAASRRVIKKAFELSRARGTGAPLDGKKRVTCVVKHNVLHGCKLFLDVYREVAAEFPDVAQDVAIVDSFAMFMLLRPESYDVVVSTNMFGDILTDLGSVLQGGMGMAVGCRGRRRILPGNCQSRPGGAGPHRGCRCALHAAGPAGLGAQRRQGKHFQHRRHCARTGVPADHPAATDACQRQGVLCPSRCRRRRALPGARSARLQFRPARRPRWRRHGLDAPRPAGQGHGADAARHADRVAAGACPQTRRRPGCQARLDVIGANVPDRPILRPTDNHRQAFPARAATGAGRSGGDVIN